MTVEIPPPPPPVPIRWRRALRELRALLADPEDTDRAMHLIYALGRRESERAFRRFVASPGGRALLAERPSLLAVLSDRPALARLPEASFGRAYLAYLDSSGFAPDGLLAVEARVRAAWERDEGVAAVDPMRAWFRDRGILAHDLFHVLTGYGTDELGEATLLAFSLAQQGGRGQALLTFGAAFEVWRALGWRWLAYDLRAWRRGRCAVWLGAVPWEELLALRLDTVRALLGIAPVAEVHPGGILRGSIDEWGAFSPA